MLKSSLAQQKATANYRAKNKELIASKMKTYYQKNKDHIKKQRMLRYHNNKILSSKHI